MMMASSVAVALGYNASPIHHLLSTRAEQLTSSVSLSSSSSSSSLVNKQISVSFLKKQRRRLRFDKISASQQHQQQEVWVSTSTESPPPSSSAQEAPPLIELEFVGPDNRPGETDPIPEPQFVTAVSSKKLLRDIMLENQVELYGPYGKMMNCEGRGMCGTCLVDILEGAELMNKRTPAEPHYLKLRPDSWRLACQATVGDGTNGGKIKVKRRPQKGNPLM